MPWSGDGGSQRAAVGATRTRALGTLGLLHAQHFRPLNLPSRLLAGELSHRDPKARLSMFQPHQMSIIAAFLDMTSP
jgi:hypothetical protein